MIPFKLYSDSTFKKMKKDELIEYIRVLYNNWCTADECLENSIKYCEPFVDKGTPKKLNHVRIEHGKHTWKRRENGEINEFAFMVDFCNGVVCEVCGESVCVHCHPDWESLEDCVEEHYDCPTCGKQYSWVEKTKYCDECGQRLDWSDES